MCKPILNLQPVQCIGIIRGPYLVGVAEDAEINPSTASRTGLDLKTGMSFAEAIENVIEILNIFDVDLFLLIAWRSVPSRFGPVPVVVPFDKWQYHSDSQAGPGTKRRSPLRRLAQD
jgi:hypothetical protein